MGSRIEMQSIHNVVITLYGVGGSIPDQLTPLGRTHQNDAVGIVGPDHRDHLFRVFFHILPGHAAIGFIADLVDHIALIPILFRHFVKEINGVLLVNIGISLPQHMPVYDHIHALAGSVLHSPVYELFQFLLVSPITISTIFITIHGQTHQIRVPVAAKRAKSLLRHIFREPGQAMGTDAVHLVGFPVLIHQAAVLHPQPPVIPHRRTLRHHKSTKFIPRPNLRTFGSLIRYSLI